jgi:hypothetical protein
MRSISFGSSMLAITCSRPPQRAHCSISIPNTRFKRRAQFSRLSLGVGCSGTASRRFWAPLPAGVTAARIVALAANTPWFFPEEDEASAPQMAAVVSHAFWSNALSGDTKAVGQTIQLNGLTFVIVGVTPKGFIGPSPIETVPDLWVPFQTLTALSPRDSQMLERPERGGWNWVQGIGRLREGVTVDAARGDLNSLSAYLKENFPVQTNQSIALNADARFIPRDGGSFEDMLKVMVVATAAVLLAGTANVAVLLSVRASEARRDVALSKALGASAARIARSALIESLVLGALGAAVGVWLSYTTSGGAATLLPASFSVSFEPDVTVLAFACALALTVGMASGLVPAYAPEAGQAFVRETLDPCAGCPGSAPRRPCRTFPSWAATTQRASATRHRMQPLL